MFERAKTITMKASYASSTLLARYMLLAALSNLKIVKPLFQAFVATSDVATQYRKFYPAVLLVGKRVHIWRFLLTRAGDKAR